MTSKFCNFIKNGLFVSHRGQGLCCVNIEKFRGLSPKDFWFGSIRKDALAKMEADRPVRGCDGCYKQEKKNITSSRTHWNAYKNIKPANDLPTMLDLDLSNFCNLKCVMCNSRRSSQHAKDLGEGVSAVSKEYLDDLLEISNDVQMITIQGGEPSIMQEFNYYFEELHKKGICKNVELQIITNMTNMNKKFLSLLPLFKSVTFQISVDAFGKANDYIRWPSKFDSIEKNISKILDIDSIKLVEIVCALNVLSLFNYKEYLHWVKRIEKLFEAHDKSLVLIPLKVFEPALFSPFIAPESLKDKFITDVKSFFMENSFGKHTKTQIELLLLCKSLAASTPNELQLGNLLREIASLDSKRSVKIEDYVPDFYDHIQKASKIATF